MFYDLYFKSVKHKDLVSFEYSLDLIVANSV